MRKRRFNRFRNRSKLVEGGLFTRIDLLQGAKSILLNFIWPGEIIFKKKNSFQFITFNFLCYCCSTNLERHLEHSGLCPDTSSLVVLTFDTKVSEYLCSGYVFFLQTSFDFLTSHF